MKVLISNNKNTLSSDVGSISKIERYLTASEYFLSAFSFVKFTYAVVQMEGKISVLSHNLTVIE